MCVALVASLTEEMAARSFAYHAHGTADSDKFCCCPWLVCHDIKSDCSLRLPPHDDKSSDLETHGTADLYHDSIG